jgi:hypothetical protein
MEIFRHERREVLSGKKKKKNLAKCNFLKETAHTAGPAIEADHQR